MKTLSLADYRHTANGQADDTAAFASCFRDAIASPGSTIVIPPGQYFLAGEKSIPLPSNTCVRAHGATFRLPPSLGDETRIVLFSGMDVANLSWYGGRFVGHCFDHRRGANTWAPSASTRMIVIGTSPGGRTDNLLFREIESERVAGAIVNVEGAAVAGSESGTHTFATNIAIRDCALVDSGKFMWDYGLLWQILVWSHEYTPADVEMARRYFRTEYIRSGIRLVDGDDRVFLENVHNRIPASKSLAADELICFFGSQLPRNITRGRQYCVIESTPTYIRIAETLADPPMRFEGAASSDAGVIVNLSQTFQHLYAPIGAGPGKGAVDLVCCRNTCLIGNRLSALGDTMHMQRCHNNIIASNQITGSRMGAFFLAEFSKNSTVTGNTVDGTNGSRVVSIEKSNEDVTVIGNTFRNGGRGTWINQPKNLVLQGNVFVNNTTKGELDPWRGRRTFSAGEYQRWPEIYFTTYEPDGRYGPVVVCDNIIETGPQCAAAVTFAAGGHDIVMDGNVVQGGNRVVRVDPGCWNLHVGTNLGAEVQRECAGENAF